MKPLVILVAGAASLALAAPAIAQTVTKQPGTQQPCQAQPDHQQKKNGEEQAPAGKDSLTETLAPCGGVLQPPATGDDELTEPAPDEGNTPVIRPGEVPPQPPKQN